MEEVAKTHSERLKFLDPEMESTNTRIEVLEQLCKANENKIDGLSKNNRMLRDIIKINDTKEITTKVSSKLIKEIHHYSNGKKPSNGHLLHICPPTGKHLITSEDDPDGIQEQVVLYRLTRILDIDNQLRAIEKAREEEQIGNF